MTKEELHKVYEWAVQTALTTKGLCASQSQYTMDCLIDDVSVLLEQRGAFVAAAMPQPILSEEEQSILKEEGVKLAERIDGLINIQIDKRLASMSAEA